MSRKQLLALAIITFLVALSPFIVFMIAISNNPFFDPVQSVNTCHFNETNGKTNQDIADLIDYPLVALTRIPEGISDKATVNIIYTDTGCLLFFRYSNRADKTTAIEILVDWTGDPPADEAWQCYDNEPSEQAQVHFQSVCSTEIEYKGKRFDVTLNAQFGASETENWAQYLTVNQT